MSYQDIFNTAISDVIDAVSPLRKTAFLDECEELLSGVGTIVDLNQANDLSSITAGPGLYLFWINLTEWHKNMALPWYELLGCFSDEWQRPAKEIKYSPRSNKGNKEKLLKNYEPSEWVPLYIGKSEMVRSRVEQHIELEESKKTYALKLKARKLQLSGAKIEVNSLSLEVGKDNYFVIGLLEALLMGKIRPIVGKK